MLERIRTHALFLQHACVATQLLENFETNKGKQRTMENLPVLVRTIFRLPQKKLEDVIDQNLPVLRKWGVSLLVKLKDDGEFMSSCNEITQIELVRTTLREANVPELECVEKEFELVVWCLTNHYLQFLAKMLENKINTLDEAKRVLSDVTVVLALGVPLRDVGAFTNALGVSIKGFEAPASPLLPPPPASSFPSPPASNPAAMSPSAQPLTLKEVVDKIKSDLGLDASLGLIPALELACSTLGVTGSNPQAKAAACAKMLVIQTNWPEAPEP